MSDWDFLHDMHNDGYSPEEIADAAACGYNPRDPVNWDHIDELVEEEGGWDTDSEPRNCLLYTSDAADDLTRLRLAGRRASQNTNRQLVTLSSIIATHR